MIARLILALLLAAFAVPAAAPAACHDASTPTRHVMMARVMTMAVETAHHSDPVPASKAVPLHGCIGCIPPSNWIAARVAAVAPADAPALVERAAILDIGLVAAPVPPPPRNA